MEWRRLRLRGSLLEFATNEPFKNPADLEHLFDGLRKVELSEWRLPSTGVSVLASSGRPHGAIVGSPASRPHRDSRRIALRATNGF